MHFLFAQVLAGYEADRVTTVSWTNQDGVFCEIAFLNDVPLNESNQDVRVNWLNYSEYGTDGQEQKRFSWVTDLLISKDNARRLVQGGRCRWKIENETFNTLKNQGYHYEHNYGHGEKNLSVVFSMLMMLAFLVQPSATTLLPAIPSRITEGQKQTGIVGRPAVSLLALYC